MTLTPEQKAAGWIEWNGDVCPIKDDRTVHQIMEECGWTSGGVAGRNAWNWRPVIAYRIIEAHGADAEPARPTPFPRDYSELVWDADGWSQTIIVDGKRPEWLRDDDGVRRFGKGLVWEGKDEIPDDLLAIRVRRREPKRETVKGWIVQSGTYNQTPITIDLIDGKPDLSTLKIAEDAL